MIRLEFVYIYFQTIMLVYKNRCLWIWELNLPRRSFIEALVPTQDSER
jgi:hypothetical protein